MPSPPVQPGDVLASKYRVEQVLGVGGMGVVVAATHLELGEKVALKFLLPELIDHPEIVARFLREAQTAIRVRSEHVARISDVGRLPSGAPYMVMEYLAGRDLAAVLAEQGALPVETAIDWVLQACEAIAEAHSLGIVHRDLKPSNLFLTRRADGSRLVKVLDFGISKSSPLGSPTAQAALTSTNSVMGSPLYMSPEQVRSAKAVDARADVWSLGVILHELLTGRPPFDGETTTAILAAVIADDPVPLRNHLPSAPAGLEAVLLGCLQKKVEDRTSTVAELADALEPFAPASARISIVRIANILRGGRDEGITVLRESSAGTPSSLPLREDQADVASRRGVSDDHRVSTAGTWGQTQPVVPPLPTPGGPPKRRMIGVMVLATATIFAVVLGALALRPNTSVTAGARGPAAPSESAPAAPPPAALPSTAPAPEVAPSGSPRSPPVSSAAVAVGALPADPRATGKTPGAAKKPTAKTPVEAGAAPPVAAPPAGPPKSPSIY